jgi:PIN domain nuclease of toxin-antitoxin system
MGVEIFDACAVIALINGEPGGPQVDSLLNDPASTCYMHSINLCEVYYQVIRVAGKATADQVISDLLSAGLISRDDMDWAFCREVGELKARGRIALPDCFCLDLAIRLGGRVVTSDHGEFDPLVPLNLCPIFFIR